MIIDNLSMQESEGGRVNISDEKANGLVTIPPDTTEAEMPVGDLNQIKADLEECMVIERLK